MVGIKPSWRIEGGGVNVTSRFSRMISMTLIDQVGYESDKLSIVLEDDDPEHAIPAKDAEVSVHIGWDENVEHKGLFKFDSYEWTFPVRTFTLHFTAADFKGSLKARDSKSFDDKTFQEVADEVVKGSGLQVKFLGDAGSKKIKHEDMTAESPLAFLLRLANERDMFAKPSFGMLVIGKNGEQSGQMSTSLRPQDVTEVSVQMSARGGAKGVRARVDDMTGGKVEYVEFPEGGGGSGGGSGGGTQATDGAGKGSGPIRELPFGFPDKETAKEAAKNAKEEQDRGQGTVTVTMPGNASIASEQEINLSGFGDKADGKWRVIQVTNSISPSGWVTVVEGERGGDVMGGGGGGSSGELITF